MRILYFFGKGGTGKSTLAAATALHAASQGKKTLLLSANQGHNLADILQAPVGAKPTEVGPNLFAQEINALAEIRAQWDTVREYVSTFLRGVGSGKAYVQEIVQFPALEDLTTLTEIWKVATSGEFEAIVIDGPPTAGAMTYLSGPAGLSWILNSIETWYRKLSLVATPVMQTLFPNRNPFDLFPEITGRIKDMRRIVTDPAVTSHRLVVVPETLPMLDGMRLLTYFHLYENPVDAVIVNRVQAGNARQQAALDKGRTAFAGFTQLHASEHPVEPFGTDALLELAKGMYGSHGPLDTLTTGRALHQLDADEGGAYRLKLWLPNLELDKLDLVTRGGELVLELGHFKRNIPLPKALLDKEAAGADYNDGTLTIDFA